MIVSDPSKFVRTGDLAHCTSLSFVGNMIRLREVNYNPFKMFDLSIATHTAIVYSDGNMCGLMEMIPDGKRSALQFVPFCDYLGQGRGGDRIISITRSLELDNENVRTMFSNELLRLYNLGVKYDTSGCLENAFSFLQDKKNDFYCSELAEYLANVCAFSFWRTSVVDDNCMPVNLQRSKYVQTILK
jgi:hypothetical protein